MQQNQAEQDVPVVLPYGPGVAGAPRIGAGVGVPGRLRVPLRDPSTSRGQAAGAAAETVGRVRRRQREGEQRLHRLTPRFSDRELEDVHVAAVLAGLTPTGFVAKAAVDVAAGRVRPAPTAVVEALAELLAARRQVQRFGVLVNQAVAKWHATDQLPGELLSAVALVGRVLPRLEQAAVAVRGAQEHGRARRRAAPDPDSEWAIGDEQS